MNSDLLHLPIPVRYRFQFKALEAISLSAYPGSAWRGLLGHGLRRVACVVRKKSCEGCALLESCVYGQVFESKVNQPESGRYRVRPHPFVLDISPATSGDVGPGDPLEFGITLFGAGDAALPYLIQGMLHAGQLGLGRTHGRFEFTGLLRETSPGSGVWRSAWDTERQMINPLETQPAKLPEMPDPIGIEILTPLRMKRKGRLVGAREFETAHFLNQLWRRVHEISHFHTTGRNRFEISLPSRKPDGMGTWEKRLKWRDWTRYSSRQKSTMQMGGLLGRWTLCDDALTEWWPLLWYGQWVHVGKASSMGLGRYRVSSARKLAGAAEAGRGG